MVSLTLKIASFANFANISYTDQANGLSPVDSTKGLFFFFNMYVNEKYILW